MSHSNTLAFFQIYAMKNTETPVNSRRLFIRNISFASAVLLTGKINFLSAAEVAELETKVQLRFAIASDFHYGQPDTLFEQMASTVIQQMNSFHKDSKLDFCVLNGDLIHNEKTFMPQVKQIADQLKVPYYVTRGNHDHVTPEEWKAVWGTALNHDHTVKKIPIILGDTSNEKGDYLSPGLAWLEERLEAHKQHPHVFLFLHIPQYKWTKNAIDTPAFFTLIHRYPNVRAVFHGHEHDQDGVNMHGKLPFLFDSHVGGNWGTAYKGFRVVELLDDGTLVTYMMNPGVKMNELKYGLV
jgi:Icc protein